MHYEIISLGPSIGDLGLHHEPGVDGDKTRPFCWRKHQTLLEGSLGKAKDDSVNRYPDTSMQMTFESQDTRPPSEH